MKVLVISHTYIVDLNCEKLRQLSQLQDDLEVVVIVPSRWRPGGVQNKIIEPIAKQESNFKIVPINNWSENNQGLLTFKADIIKFLKEFKPDIIQVEQGAKSLAYAQLITLNKLLNLKAKNVFFTWWNLPYKNKFPISLLEKYNLSNTDGLISGNQDGVDILREHGYQNKAIVLPQLGVDETLFAPRQQIYHWFCRSLCNGKRNFNFNKIFGKIARFIVATITIRKRRTKTRNRANCSLYRN